MPVIDRTASILTPEILDRCAARAAGYDRDNRFFQEDFDELKAAGYLLLTVPKAFGGAGLNLAEVCREQARLAYSAPATAVAVNMHLYWTGVAADLNRAGDHTLDWLLKESAKYRAVEGARRVVDIAMDVSGGTGMFKKNELERLYRDVRCGGFHPANSAITHEIVGKTALGVLGEAARW